MSLIAAALDTHQPLEDASSTWRQTCVGSKYHTPKPLLVSEVAIGADSGVWLCATCASNVEVFVFLLDAADGDLPWAVRREFGNRIRVLGMKVWEHKERHG